MSTRSVTRVITAHRQLEGGGFPVRRPIPTDGLELVDPFLLLDELGPVEWGPGEAIGAPDHPHRGFETVTYVVAGRMEHRDSAGHTGTLGPGDVQWMTAGAGVVHSEMPEREFRRRGGTMHGFQIWVNLPRADKMMKPRYQEIASAEIPEAATADGDVRVRVIAGESLGARAVIETRTPISFLHFTLQPAAAHEHPTPPGHNAMAWVFSGRGRFGPEHTPASSGQLVLFDGDGDTVSLRADGDDPLRLLLLTGKALDEPVARYGPFVMNTPAEIEQAFRDYQAGRLGQIA